MTSTGRQEKYLPCNRDYLTFRSYHIGVFSNHPSIQGGIRHIFSTFLAPPPPCIHSRFDVLWYRDRYIITEDREIIFTTEDRMALVPYLEWAITYRLMKNFDRFTQIHAAVLEKRNRGIILTGGSNVGKSTLSLALTMQGYNLLSDEICLMDLSTGRMHAFPKALRIDKKSLGLLKNLGYDRKKMVPYHDHHNKICYYINPLEIEGKKISTKMARLSHIFFLRPSVKRKKFSLLNLTGSISRLLKNTVNLFPPGEKGVDNLIKRLGRINCYEISGRYSLDKLADIIDEAVEGY